MQYCGPNTYPDDELPTLRPTVDAQAVDGSADQDENGMALPDFLAGDCRVRSFSLAKLGGGESGDQVATEYLCRLLVKRWLGDENRTQLNGKELEALVSKFTALTDLRTAVH